MSVLHSSTHRERLIFRFNEMRPMLLALANENLCRDIQAKVGASDIVQQTMLEAFQHVHTLQAHDDRHLFKWLSTILLNNLRDVSRSFRNTLKRSINREQPWPSDDKIAERKCFLQLLELQEDLDVLSNAVNRLPHAHQEILTWLFHEQMTYPQISALVGRSEDAVRMLVRRALHRLAREMLAHDNASTN